MDVSNELLLVHYEKDQLFLIDLCQEAYVY